MHANKSTTRTSKTLTPPPSEGPLAARAFDRPRRPDGPKKLLRPGILRSAALPSWVDEDPAFERRDQLLRFVRAVAIEASSDGWSLRKATCGSVSVWAR